MYLNPSMQLASAYDLIEYLIQTDG